MDRVWNQKIWKVMMHGSQHNDRSEFRKENTENWKFYNADFNHDRRLFYDLDLGTHISVNCQLIDNLGFPVNI